LFAINIHFTYTRKKALLIIGIVFSALLGPYEHLKFLNVQLQCGERQADTSLFTVSRQLCTSDSKFHRPETTFEWMCNSNKIKLCFLCAERCREEGNLWINFNL